MAEHEGVGAGRSFYETASAEEQANKYSDLREGLEQIKADTSIPFSEDWWNDQRIWGGPITVEESGHAVVGEVSKLSKVFGLLNIAQMATSSGLYPGLSVQQVGFNYQPLIIVEEQPTTALALWEDNLPVLSLNGAASVPMPLPVGQMGIAYNSDLNGVHYPVGFGAMPVSTFLSSIASSIGYSIDWDGISDGVKEAINSAISNYKLAKNSELLPIVFDSNGQVYGNANIFDIFKAYLDGEGGKYILNSPFPYIQQYTEAGGYPVSAGITTIRKYQHSTYSDTWTEYTNISANGANSVFYNANIGREYNSTYDTWYYPTSAFSPRCVLFYSENPFTLEYDYRFHTGSRRHPASTSVTEQVFATMTEEFTHTSINASSYTYQGRTVYHAIIPLGSYNSGTWYLLPFQLSGNPNTTISGPGGSSTGYPSNETMAWTLLYASDETSTLDGVSFWEGDIVDYTQGGIEIITNPSIDPEPEVQPYYPMYIPDPYTNPGKTVSPEVNPNPHAPSEFPNITPFIQPQIDPEVLPEKEKEEKTTRELTLPFPTVLPINDPSSVVDPTTDPSQLDWPLPDTPEPPPTPPAPPKPSGITPDIGVPDPTLWPTIIPDHSIAGQGAPGLIHVYNPTPQQFVDFGRWLWVTYADATIDKIWNNPFDGVISAHELYYTPTTGAVQNIRSGFLVSTASAAVVPVRYTNINCGTMIIPEYWANYLDYSPYSKAHVYLPFIGIVELDVDDIVGHAVNITYAVDAYNGSCIAQITVAKTNYQNTVYQFSGNCSVEVPLSGGSQAALKSAMLTAGAYGLTSVVAGIMGSVGTAMSGAYGALGSLLNPISQKSSVQHSGSFGASHGAMGIKKPFIIIRRPIQKIVNNYNAEYGFPAHKAVLVGNCTGYLRVREVNVISATATNEEKAKIEELLKEGVYVT